TGVTDSATDLLRSRLPGITSRLTNGRGGWPWIGSRGDRYLEAQLHRESRPQRVEVDAGAFGLLLQCREAVCLGAGRHTQVDAALHGAKAHLDRAIGRKAAADVHIAGYLDAQVEDRHAEDVCDHAYGCVFTGGEGGAQKIARVGQVVIP